MMHFHPTHSLTQFGDWQFPALARAADFPPAPSIPLRIAQIPSSPSAEPALPNALVRYIIFPTRLGADFKMHALGHSLMEICARVRQPRLLLPFVRRQRQQQLDSSRISSYA
jgi:hypothetical protein